MENVLQVITDNNRRGGQVFASDLHVALEGRGIAIRTVALAPASWPSRLDFEVLGPSRRHPNTLSALRTAMTQSSIVVAHGSTTLPMCAIAGIGLGIPFVYRQISQQTFWAGTPYRRIRTRLALRAADHIIALWQGAADVLTSYFGIPSNRITIVPNGVPARRCPPVDSATKRAARLRLGLESDRSTLLYVGALAPEKGVDILVRAMSHPALNKWQLLIVGSGPEYLALERMASRLPDGLVRFHGPVATASEAIAAADVVGLTSRGGDSMPAVLIEAGMMEVPAVATSVEGIIEVVTDGQTGCIVPIDDPVATAVAVADVGRRVEEFGRAAKAHCFANFEMDRIAARWHETLEEVAATCVK
jgi:glycosyltransferase involved in cell wall biosynthesis